MGKEDGAGRNRPILLVLSAPSGAGKTTVARRLVEDYGFTHVVTATTRPPRPRERNGIDYLFVDRETFLRWIEEGNLFEWAEIYGNLYGIPKDHLYRPLKEGRDVVLTVDVNGKRALERVFRDDPSVRFVSVFLKPPSLDVLRERLLRRGDPPEEVERRLKKAEEEMAWASEYDHVVINDDLTRTVGEIARILGLDGQDRAD